MSENLGLTPGVKPAPLGATHMSTRAEVHYFGLFDPLRAALAFAVFLSHANILPEEVGDVGGFAVQVFFALSGFLVGGILLESAQKKAFWRNVPEFYFNRCIRIWVPYGLLVLSYATLMFLRGYWSNELETRLVPLVTYTHNWANEFMGLSPALGPINHAWSLAVEEQFYLLCPLIAGVVRNRVVIICVMLALTVALPFSFGISYYSAICLGVAAAAARQLMPGEWWVRVRYLALLVGVPAVFYLMAAGFKAMDFPVSIASALIVVGLSGHVPKRPFLYLLGAMSYSFYLFHWMGLYVGTPIAKKFAESHYVYVKALVALAVATAISYASVRLLEWPLLRRRRAIAERFPWLLPVAMVVALSLTSLGMIWLWFTAN